MADLTPVQLQLLAALKAFSPLSDAPCADLGLSCAQYEALFELCGKNKLVAVCYSSVKELRSFAQLDSAFKERWRAAAVALAAAQVNRERALLSACERLDAQGVRYLVVKGVVCRRMYADPYLRESADEDFFIPATDLPRCADALKSLGFARAEEVGGVVTLRHAASGLKLELHSGYPLELDSWSNAQSVERFSCQGGSAATPHPTHHWAFLVMHALKHFTYSGFGARTLMDIAVFAFTYRSHIDYAEAQRILERAGALTFCKSVLAIARDHLGFDAASAHMPRSFTDDCPDITPMLLDILDAGVYGQSSLSRVHSASMVRSAAERGSRTANAAAALFPPIAVMRDRYGYLRRLPWLLPWAWLCRIATYVTRGRTRGDSARESLRIAEARIRLLRLYDISEHAKGRG
ncbi:MAG: nucleotidyltransferase family protein [Clostridia bacterium]|nr:nucleotidyltransferase family protein [Clostridia bacterium]